MKAINASIKEKQDDSCQNETVGLANAKYFYLHSIPEYVERRERRKERVPRTRAGLRKRGVWIKK
jgi:hypothetical protein